MFDEQRPNVLATFAVPVVASLFMLLILLVAGGAEPPESEPDSEPAPPAATDLTPAEQAFSAQLTDVVLTGHFTVEGQPGNAKPEKYQIVSAKKVGEHDWLINARIAYGENSAEVPPLPIPVQVHWAGDTPVLSLTNLTIPGMGTFTSRVMFFKDRYAGTWRHGEKGGHLYGTMIKADAYDEQKP